MVFMKNDPKTKQAGTKGGKSGDKHFMLMPKKKLSQVSRQAGQRSGEVRRRKKVERETKQLTDKQTQQLEQHIMHDYLD